MSDRVLFFVLGVASTLGLLLSAFLMVWAAIETRNARLEQEALERESTPHFNEVHR